MSKKRFTVDKDFVEYPKLVDMETKCFYHFDDSLRNVEIFCERLNELSTNCRQLNDENEKLSKFEIEHIIALLKDSILKENTSTQSIRYDVKLIDKLEKMLRECDGREN